MINRIKKLAIFLILFLSVLTFGACNNLSTTNKQTTNSSSTSSTSGKTTNTIPSSTNGKTTDNTTVGSTTIGSTTVGSTTSGSTSVASTSKHITSTTKTTRTFSIIITTITTTSKITTDSTIKTTQTTGEIDEDIYKYYQSVLNLSGEALKRGLYDIIKGHNAQSYGSNLNTYMCTTDQDPNNKNNVILFYTQLSVPCSSANSIWNKEHVWAKSHGSFGTSKGPGSDLHHLRPTEMRVNSTRGNLDFAEVENGKSVTYTYNGKTGYLSYYNSSYFEPDDSVKGDVARIIFYMATRYYYEEYKLTINNKANGTSGAPGYMGNLEYLMKWHIEDPVSDMERRRNDAIYDIQHNRNPYIDFPEFANSIWSDAYNQYLAKYGN